MSTPRFPFPELPTDDSSPQVGAGDKQELLRRDIAIVNWFVHRWTQQSVSTDCSLGQLLDYSARVDLNSESPSLEERDPAQVDHALHLTSGLVRLAWAIRALHGGEGRVDRVDGTFITKELLGEDSKQKTVEKTLPGGIGTLVIAGRLLQAGGGRIVSINGNGVKGHDIRWQTAGHDTVLVERKDRSYEAGLTDSMEKRARKVVEEIRRAAAAFPREPSNAARVLVVGFANLVRPEEFEKTDVFYQRVLADEFGANATSLDNAPHLVLIEHLGFEGKTGGMANNFFSPQLLGRSHRFRSRVAPLVVRALGIR